MEQDSQLVHDGVPWVAVGPVQVADVPVVGRPDQSEVSIAAPPIRGEYCGSTNHSSPHDPGVEDGGQAEQQRHGQHQHDGQQHLTNQR